jgi:hypothetical protein
MFHVSDKYSLTLIDIFPEKNHSNMGDVLRLSDKYVGAANHFPGEKSLKYERCSMCLTNIPWRC